MIKLRDLLGRLGGGGGGGRAIVWRRFRRDPVGLASLGVLCLIAIACFGSLLVSPHPYDAVYPDYVMQPASFTAHPTPAELKQGFEALAAKTHTTVKTSDAPGGLKALVLYDRGLVDPRILRYLDRSDMLALAAPIESTDEGRAVETRVKVLRQTFLFGTDANGRDLLTRILVAGRISLAVGALASAVALGIGVIYGAISGYVGGRLDGTMMRLVDLAYALPFVFLVIVLVVVFGRTLWFIFLAIGAVEWLDMSRIVRGQTLSLKRREFVLAAQALGEGGGRILARHVVPNMSGPIVAYLALLVPRVILAESFLSFLGLGVQEPLTSWGILIADGARNVQGSVNLLIFPAVALAATVVAASQLGEAVLRAANAADA